MKRLKLTLLLVGMGLTLFAQSPREQFKENIYKSGSNYYAYPGPSQKRLTPAPKGYEPYYISHYGRHGSRYLINKNDYNRAYRTLMRADSLDKLTPFGKDVLRRVTLLRAEADKRLGELTLLGAQQHREIAHRMYERFPKVFKGETNIDAKSTVVIRCILSMENALQELRSLNPKLKIRHDASEHDMWYMNSWEKPLKNKQWNPETRAAYDAFKKNHRNYDRVMQSLFNDTAYINHQVGAERLNGDLFKLASNIQSTELRHSITLYDLFTPDEIYDNWMIENAGWYISYGHCPMNGALQPFTQRHLLRKMIEEADSCLPMKHPGASLRFGHEVCVMPLACLLELNNCGKQVSDLEKLPEEGWINYEIYPMGCNVQLVFYKPKKGKGDILVKALLNENEATLPLKAVSGPYYKWSDFRAYFMKKLDSFKPIPADEEEEEEED
ncbi:MAG: histidine phosphatase family protein [Prevotella sp.]|nr:histidine phosphatase family protein [Prevotella sp.]